jgi:hypothetical protein
MCGGKLAPSRAVGSRHNRSARTWWPFFVPEADLFQANRVIRDPLEAAKPSVPAKQTVHVGQSAAN